MQFPNNLLAGRQKIKTAAGWRSVPEASPQYRDSSTLRVIDLEILLGHDLPGGSDLAKMQLRMGFPLGEFRLCLVRPFFVKNGGRPIALGINCYLYVRYFQIDLAVFVEDLFNFNLDLPLSYSLLFEIVHLFTIHNGILLGL